MKRRYYMFHRPLLLLSLICCLAPQWLRAQTNRLTVGSVEAVQGEKVSLPVFLDNESAVAGGQFELLLPAGMTVDGVTLNESRAASHTLQYRQKAGGALAILFYASPTALLNGTSGELCSVSLTVSDDYPTGKYDVTVGGGVRFASDAINAIPMAESVAGAITVSPASYNVTVTASEGGSVTGGGQYLHGEEVTLTAVPEEGYEFAGWSDGTNDNPYTFTAKGNVEMEATFTKKVYSVTIKAAEGGSVTGGGQYLHGEEVTLTAVPEEGYEFAGWSDGTNDNPYTFTAKGNVEMEATFTKKVYSVTITAAEGGSVTGGGQYMHGEEVTLTAVPEEGYEFAGWSDGTNDNPYTFTAKGNVEMEATFTKKVYNVTITAAEGGSVTGDGQYLHGEEVTLTAVPEEGYEFAGWSDGTNDNPYTFTAKGNVEMEATFTKKVYSVTITAAEGGSVTGGGQYLHGEEVTLTAVPEEGYEFAGWSDGTNDNPYTFTAKGNVEMEATFTKKVYSVTITAAEGGSVTGGGQYLHGEEVTLTAVPEEGYEFAGWSDGTNDNPYTFTAKGNVEMAATFTKIVSGISAVKMNKSTVNVYSVTGQIVKKDVAASELSRLISPGLYIIDGKKMIVK